MALIANHTYLNFITVIRNSSFDESLVSGPIFFGCLFKEFLISICSMLRASSD